LKRHCEYAAHDEQVLTQDKKVKFEIFITLFDIDLISIKKRRFDQLYKHMETWGSLCNFCETPKNKSWLNCSDLHLVLPFGSGADIETAPSLMR
jgi:putative heme iron utilization protein